MYELVDVHCPDTKRIRVVQDNLSILYQPPGPPKAVESCNPLHPKHASWLNMVEIEIGVPRDRCSDQRINVANRLVTEIGARNDSAKTLAHASDGCSQRKKPAPKWVVHIPTP
jgi:hypothetical protein